MKKNLISFAVAAVIAAAPMGALADETPSVVVDGAPIIFSDQAPVIVNDRTLVPARGVFEAMDADVKWYESKNLVEITSDDNLRIVRMYIDNPVMEVYTFENSLLNAAKDEITLDVPPQLMNDRTMIPLRAIGEALKATVNWDENANEASIISGRHIKTESETAKVSLSAGADTAAAGETFDLFLNVSNMAAYPNCRVANAAAEIEFDKTAFELVSAALVNGDVEINGTLYDINNDYTANSSRIAVITADSSNSPDTDGKILKITVKSLTGTEGSFKLGNGFLTFNKNYSTTIGVEDESGIKTVGGIDLVVDQTPVTVNAGK